MKTRLQVVSTVLTILSAAILLTIYLAWLFYRLEIEWLQLEKVVYMKAEDILYNFHILMKYLTNPFQQVLDMPNFSSSADGLHHFEQVKWLFHFTQLAFLISLPASLVFFKDVLRKGYGSLFQKTYFWMAVLPLLIGGMGGPHWLQCLLYPLSSNPLCRRFYLAFQPQYRPCHLYFARNLFPPFLSSLFPPL